MSYKDLLVDTFKKHKPKTIEDALVKCEIEAEFLAEGVFRRSFRLDGYPIVAKFPKGDGKREIDIEHTNDEIKLINKILKDTKLEILRSHVPEIYYHDKKNGVVLMKYYYPLELCSSVELWAPTYEKVCKKLDDLLDFGGADIDQFGIEDGRLICLDFGLVGEKRRIWNAGGYQCL